jgi:adenylate cyclase
VTSAPKSVDRQAKRRKLVAVVHADVVGYSRLIGLDDTGTLERLRALRRDLIDPAIAEHGGRVVNTAGDALFMVFDSADGAVRCALEVQQQVPAFEADQYADRRIGFRIGINVGDAIPDGTDLHGDVVNVTARLQAECPPGGICISRAVHEHVRGRLELPFEAKGPLDLKNIDQPVEAFVLRPEALIPDKSVERTLVHGTGEALPLPDKPSIAVLAFTNMSGDLEQEYFSDGIADDIITELSRSRSLFVIARNSSFTYRGRSVDVRQVARELGVRYVLEGSVRRSGDRVRVVAQLIDAGTGNHIWAERYDRALEGVFAVQDEITTAVVASIVPAVADAELRRVLRKPPDGLGAWEAYQRGLWHFGKGNATDNKLAGEFLQQAAILDASFAQACTAMGLVLIYEGVVFATRPLHEAASLASSWARKALEIDDNDADANAIAAYAGMMGGIGEECWARASTAIAINPNSSWAHIAHGALLVYSDRPVEGRKAALTALRLSPRDPINSSASSIVFLSYYFEHDYPNALEAARRAVSRFPDLPIAHRYLAATLGKLSRIDEAQEALQRAMALSQAVLELNVRSHPPPWMRPEDHENFKDGLRKAGWQG